MSKKRIFISSVQREFAKERMQLCGYIRQDALLGRFFEPFLFEELPAINASAEQAYLSEISNCDIYLGILGEQYGFQDHEGISPTEREFDEATVLQKYRICFFKTLLPPSERESKQQRFVEKIEHNVVRKTFDGFETLRSAVYSSLVRYLEESELLRMLPFDAAYHPEAGLDDIDEKKIDLFVRIAQKARNFPLPLGTPTVDVLTHLNLVNVRQQIKNAAILLFGKNPQRFFQTSEIKCAQFYGNEVTKPIPSYHVYQGDLFSLVNQAVDFVASRIDARVGTREHSAQAPVDFELPLDAIREAMVNAVAHRDYTSNASIQVMLFKNRLEVWNPGHLPPGITIEQLYQVHESFPTNPLIANPLYLAGYAERLGTGTMDIIKKCVAIGLKPPAFSQSNNFRTTFWRNEEISEANPTTSESNPITSESNPTTSESNPTTSEPNPITLRPAPETLRPAPETLRPALETLRPDPEILRPDPEILKPLDNIPKRMTKTQIEDLVLSICSDNYLTAPQIATIIRRNAYYIINEILPPMLAEEKLVRLYPETPNHPNQAYRANKTGSLGKDCEGGS